MSNWPLKRFLLSRIGNLYTRMLLGIPQCNVTAGLKCWWREVLESIHLDTIEADGYAFQIEMCWNAWKQEFSIFEVPINFVEQAQGVSKMSWGGGTRKSNWRSIWSTPSRPLRTQPAGN